LATLHHLSPNSLIIKSALPSVAPGELYKIEQSSVVPSVLDTVHLSTKLSQVWMCPRKAECAPFDSLSQINGKWTYFPQ
ncbi:hypothetical protein PSHT_10402, partial [Puccinia striiformis]